MGDCAGNAWARVGPQAGDHQRVSCQQTIGWATMAWGGCHWSQRLAIEAKEIPDQREDAQDMRRGLHILDGARETLDP